MQSPLTSTTPKIESVYTIKVIVKWRGECMARDSQREIKERCYNRLKR